MMDDIDYIEYNPSDLVGKKFDNGFKLNEEQALAILKTYAPEKISNAVTSYTIDTIKGHTYLIGLTPNGYVDFMYEMETTGSTIGPVQIDDEQLEVRLESKQYMRMRTLFGVALVVLVIAAILILKIIG